MSGWLLSIAGMILTTTLAEIILPEGETAKFIKGVIGIMVVYVVILPFPRLLATKFDVNSFFNFSENSYETQGAFIQIIEQDRLTLLSETLTAALKEQGYAEAYATVVPFGDGGEEKGVIAYCNAAHRSGVIEVSQRVLNIDSERIVVYEI